MEYLVGMVDGMVMDWNIWLDWVVDGGLEYLVGMGWNIWLEYLIGMTLVYVR